MSNNHDDPWFYWNQTKEITPSDLDSISSDEKQKILNEWDGGIWTEKKPSIDVILSNIKLLPSIRLSLTKWEMDRLKECADDFVRQRWFSSIVLAIAIIEYHTFYLIQEYIKKNSIFPVIEHIQNLKNHYNRIRVLKDLGIILETDLQELIEINELRKKYLHVQDVGYQNIKDDCLKIIKKLIGFLRKYPITTPLTIT